MVNNTDFSKRLKMILEYYQLSASAFAEKINVQRSSISHLLSGRNKPSLDFVLKVLETFKEVDLYWLLNGKGSFPKKEKKLDFPTSLFSEKENESEKIVPKTLINDNLKNGSEQSIQQDEIDKIVIFYKNGTFKLYNKL